MYYVRACLHLIDVLTIRHNDQTDVVAQRQIALAEHEAQLPECDRHMGPTMAGDGDGGAKMILDSITEELDRAYKALENIPPPC